jgi:hypothetical protein
MRFAISNEAYGRTPILALQLILSRKNLRVRTAADGADFVLRGRLRPTASVTAGSAGRTAEAERLGGLQRLRNNPSPAPKQHRK